jgi:hypothetical protein
MARVDWIDRRLLNWARWKLGDSSGPGGYAGVNMANPTPGIREPYEAAPIPVVAVEASETDTAVNALCLELRHTVTEFYTGRGGLSDHLQRLGCAKATLYARLDRADRELVAWFNAKDQRARAERQRVEQLQRAARPTGSFTP